MVGFLFNLPTSLPLLEPKQQGVHFVIFLWALFSLFAHLTDFVTTLITLYIYFSQKVMLQYNLFVSSLITLNEAIKFHYIGIAIY